MHLCQEPSFVCTQLSIHHVRETGGIMACLWKACEGSVPVRGERNSSRAREFLAFGPRKNWG